MIEGTDALIVWSMIFIAIGGMVTLFGYLIYLNQIKKEALFENRKEKITFMLLVGVPITFGAIMYITIQLDPIFTLFIILGAQWIDKLWKRKKDRTHQTIR